MGIRKLHLSLCVCLIPLAPIFLGCSKRNISEPNGYDTQRYSHTVKYYGENLTIIAMWYSGSAKAAEEILKYNPNLKGKTLQMGTKVQIPSVLMKRRAPLPKDFVRETILSKPKKSKQRAPQVADLSPTPNSESTQLQPSTNVITNSPESAARRRQVLQELLEE